MSTPLITAEQDAAKHTIAIEPVGVTTQIVIGDCVSSVADVLAVSELARNGTSIGLWGGEQLCWDRNKIASQPRQGLRLPKAFALVYILSISIKHSGRCIVGVR